MSKKNIPRGFRKAYIPCLNNQSQDLYNQYLHAYNTDPLAEDTIELGEALLESMSKEKQECWQELITGSTDMTYNSKKAWKTIGKLNCEKNDNTRIAAVTPDAVAHLLLLNGKPENRERV